MARKGRYSSGLAPFGGAPVSDLSTYNIAPMPTPVHVDTPEEIASAASEAAWAQTQNLAAAALRAAYDAQQAAAKNTAKPLPKPKVQTDTFIAAAPPPKPTVAPAKGVLPIPVIPTVKVPHVGRGN